MSVRLEAIQFNHDPGGASTDAFDIRRNASQPVELPEWRHGLSKRPEHSPGAYAMRATEGRTITIQAQFSTSDPDLGQVEIRAIEPQFAPVPNVLGEVQAQAITFPAGGTTGFEIFQLQNVRVHDAGVSVSTTTWHWQYRRGGGAWTDFETTQHRIYVVVELPKSPWMQVSQGVDVDLTQLPWTEVLDHACAWAEGEKDIDPAAARVTRAINDLGPSGLLTYDCTNGGGSHYVSRLVFLCTRFLELLRGETSNGIYVDCGDCATAVSTFANALGAELSQGRMEILTGGEFGLNPVLLIGSSVWQPCFSSFDYHEVAWKGKGKVEDEIFDACLQLDGDPTPTAFPHTPLLPTNLKFGKVGTLLYRDRLVVPNDRKKCRPSAGHPVRRTVV